MINIKSFASSSNANAYLIDDNILIDCGMPFTELRKSSGFNLSLVTGCLLSHSHKDHSKSANKIMQAGIDLYTSKGTARTLNLYGHRLKIIEPFKCFVINNTWSILSFNTIHDSQESLGFVLINDKECILFATDTAYIEYRFSDLTYIMIECNYQLERLNSNVICGLIPLNMKNRIITSHFSLKNVCKFLKANNLDKVKAIYLLHMSKTNCNRQEAKETIQGLTGKPVFIC